MISKLDKSLDDIIQSAKPIRRSRQNNRGNPYKKSNDKNTEKSGGDSTNTIGQRVYVGNLSYKTAWQELKDYFKSAGSVAHADVLRFDDGKSKGCGIVKFDTAEGAKNAIDTLNDTELDGRLIFVREDREAQGVGSGNTSGNYSGRGSNFGLPVFNPNSNLAQKIRNKAPPNCIVYIGNLPFSTEWQELKDLCSKYGSVGRADVEQGEDGRSRGYGIAVFDDAEGANKCIEELNGAEFEGRELEVRLDKIRSAGETYNNRGTGFRNAGNAKVFVGNLPWSVEWQDLKDLCKRFGNVMHADIPQNDRGLSKGYGIVRFATAADASNCVNSLNGMLLDGRDLNVRFDRG